MGKTVGWILYSIDELRRELRLKIYARMPILTWKLFNRRLKGKSKLISSKIQYCECIKDSDVQKLKEYQKILNTAIVELEKIDLHNQGEIKNFEKEFYQQIFKFKLQILQNEEEKKI